MYIKRCCSDCIFYSKNTNNGYGRMCNINGDSLDKSDSITWVSENDCNKDDNIAKEYYSECKYYNSIMQIKNNLRKQYGIGEFYWSLD